MTIMTHHIRQMSQVLRFAGEHRMFNLAFKTFGTLGLADNHWLIVQRYCHCHFNPGSSSVPLLVRTTLADFLGQSQNSSATTGQCTSGFCRQRKKCIKRWDKSQSHHFPFLQNHRPNMSGRRFVGTTKEMVTPHSESEQMHLDVLLHQW